MGTRKDRQQDRRIADIQRQVLKRPRYQNMPQQMPSFARTVGYGSTRNTSMTEVKGVDTNIVVTPLYVATPIPLNDVRSGSSSFNRIGRKFNMKSIHLRGFFELPNNCVVDGPVFYRIFIVYDKQSNGIAMAPATDFFGAQYATGVTVTTAANNIYAPMDLNFRERYEIIMDKTYQMNLVTSGPASLSTDLFAQVGINSELKVDEFRKLKRREVQYKADGSNANGTDIQTGALWFFVVSSENAAIQMSFVGNARLRYYDV